MNRDRQTRQGRRQVDRLGVEVKLTNYTKDGESTRGVSYTKTSDSPKTINAIPDPGGTSVSLDLDGGDVDIDMVYMVRDDIAGIRDGGDNQASIIEHRNTRFIVNVKRDFLQAGQYVLACEKD